MKPPPSAVAQRVARLANALPELERIRLVAELRKADACPLAIDKLVRSQVVPATGDQLQKLIAAAQEEAVSFASVALALEAAGAALARAEHDRVRAVWTTPGTSTPGSRLTAPLLRELIQTAKVDLWVTSFAVHKISGIVTDLAAASGRGVDIRLVLETVATSGGKLTFDQVDYLRAKLPAVTLLGWPKDRRPVSPNGEIGVLHAKIAVADRRRLLVTSANLTEFALHYNLELGLHVEGPHAAESVASHLARLVSRGDLQTL